MIDFTCFEDIFGFEKKHIYDDDMINDIQLNRICLERLFIDRLIIFLGIKKPSKHYPPESYDDLKSLHNAIIESDSADQHKLSVLYYILLDYEHAAESNIPPETLKEFPLPPKYQILTRGLWFMDRKQFECALQYIAHPSLNPSFTNEIMETLVNSSGGDMTLPLAYYHTIQPQLSNEKGLEILFSAFAKSSVTEAFYFSRKHNECAQRNMFEMLIATVLNDSTRNRIPVRSMELVNLPFTSQETSWFEEYLTEGEGRESEKAADILMMRLIATGNFSGFLSLQVNRTRKVDDLDWDTIADASRKGLGPR
ncbi:unnamed protein product [Blumeria hordei]|uniref:ELYS-like domain-containing protein n=1 Tax=Blumeria hordei TaxID=2867405 RepID=A0A383UTW2_BLUHO|nr:unnamed protein product [Blumeria hordei]